MEIKKDRIAAGGGMLPINHYLVSPRSRLPMFFAVLRRYSNRGLRDGRVDGSAGSVCTATGISVFILDEALVS